MQKAQGGLWSILESSGRHHRPAWGASIPIHSSRCGRQTGWCRPLSGHHIPVNIIPGTHVHHSIRPSGHSDTLPDSSLTPLCQPATLFPYIIYTFFLFFNFFIFFLSHIYRNRKKGWQVADCFISNSFSMQCKMPPSRGWVGRGGRAGTLMSCQEHPEALILR